MSNAEFEFLKAMLSGSNTVEVTAMEEEEARMNNAYLQKQKEEEMIVANRKKASLLTRIKIIMSTLQVLALCPTNMRVSFPPMFTSISGVLSILNLNIVEMIPLRCIGNYGFLTVMYFMTIFPAVVVFIGLLCMLSTTLQMYRSETNPIIRVQKYVDLKLRYLSMFLIFTNFILPPVSLNIFKTLICIDLDPYHEEEGPQNYMGEDMSINCANYDYMFGKIWAGFMVIVYPFGIPLLYFLLLWYCRKEIRLRGELQSLQKSVNIHPSKRSILENSKKTTKALSSFES